MTFEGELKIWEQEGGYCSPVVEIDGKDITMEIQKYIESDGCTIYPYDGLETGKTYLYAKLEITFQERSNNS